MTAQHPGQAGGPHASEVPKVPGWAYMLGTRAIPPAPCPASRHSPDPLHVICTDGRLGVSVPLRGKHGTGKRVTLDALDWERVRKSHGDRWTLKDNGNGHEYVVSMGQATRVSMARLVARAEPGDAVMLLNGPLDLCRGALERVEKREAVRRALGH